MNCTPLLWPNTEAGLTPDEAAILAEAKRSGYLIRSGWRVRLLLAWREWCRQTGTRCVVARLGAREAMIEVDGVVVLKVPADELEHAAARIVHEHRKAAG